ncbi:DUF6498-containing protein [Thermodesulfobacteriota bacterium]
MLPEKNKDNFSLVALITANLIPFIGIFFFDWDVTFIVLLYWFENLIAGFYNILKMALLKVDRTLKNANKFFIIPFFCLHYGAFCGAHGLFLTVFFKIGESSSPFPANQETWPMHLVFIQILLNVIAKIWANRPPQMIWALLGLFISHGISFWENYILGQEYKTGSLKKLMHQPYQRIIVMHIAIIAGGIFVMQLNSPLPLLIILIMLKIFFDLYLHKKSHRPKKQMTEDDAAQEKMGISD